MQSQRLGHLWSETRSLVLGLVALAAACGGVESSSPDSNAELSGALTCPQPRANADAICQPNKVWAREVRSGMCCAYEDLCVAPTGWPVFESEQACRTSCRCAMLTGDPTNPVEHTSLDCACKNGECTESLATVVSNVCARSAGASVFRSKGCGLVQLAFGGGFWASSSVFDESSGALVGMSTSSDTTSLPCQTFNWVAGRSFECDNVQTCQLCGLSEPGIARCN